MSSYSAIALSTLAFLWTAAALPSAAAAQSAKDLVGSWIVTAVDLVAPDGSRTPIFGPSPKGTVMFDSDGRYAELIMRTDLPKFTSANRMQGSADENKAVSQGTLSFFGAYSVADKVVTLTVEGSSYPNWTGGDQKRTLTAFSPDEFKWTNSAGSGGGLAELTARRVK